MKFILGKKIAMTQIFDDKNNVIPVTLIEAGPCFVTQVKDKSVQIGFEKLKEKKIKKSNRTKPYKHLREFKADVSKYKEGDKIDVLVFKEGEKVKVSGTSKGKGFQGIIKRHGTKRKPASHGTKHEVRAVGSTGSRFPQRVIKGRTMPGRMGSERITIKGLKIAKVDSENNLLAIKGAVPGRKGTLLEIYEG